MAKQEKRQGKKSMKSEEKKGGFKCCYCGQWVRFSEFMGTAHRNHCPYCLWSKHVDDRKVGDRKSRCQKPMKPIGLTFKWEGVDKYNNLREGELMLIHECTGCGKISINRIAADDNEETILKVFDESQKLPLQKKVELQRKNIAILSSEAKERVITQLFGKIN